MREPTAQTVSRAGAGRADPGVVERLRAFLEAVVFPQVERASLSRGRIATLYLLGFVTGAAYLTLIPAGRSHFFRVWAEDGTRWLSETAGNPPLTLILSPYGGYFHVVPRLLGDAVVHLFPPTAWAAAIAVGAIVVRVGCALLVFHAARGHVPARIPRLVLASAVIWLPVGNAETLNNAANLHWFLFFTLFWVILWRPRTGFGYLGQTLAILLTSLSVPLAVLLAPLALARLFLTNWRDRIGGGAALIAMCATVLQLLSAREARPHATPNWAELLLSGVFRGPVTMLIGPQAAHEFLAHASSNRLIVAGVTTVVGLCVTVIMVAGMMRGAPRERFVILALAAVGTVALLFSLATNWQESFAAQDRLVGVRYSATPGLLYFSAVAIALGVIFRRSRVVAIVVSAVVGLLIFSGAMIQLTYASDGPASPVLTGPVWSDEVDRATEECLLGGADDVLVDIAPQWQASIPCDALK